MHDTTSIFVKYNLAEYLTKSMLVTLVSTLIISLFPIILSHFYTTSIVGKLTFVVTSVAIIKTFSSFGMSSLLIRTFANKDEEIPLLASVVIYSVSAVILLMLANWYALEFFNVEFLLKIALPISLISLLASALQGFNYYKIAHLLNQSLVETILLIAIAVGLLSSPNFELSSILDVSLILVILTILLCLFILVKALKNTKRDFSREIISNVKKSGHLFFFSTFALILSATDQFIILYYLDYSHLGIYAVAIGLAAFAAIGINVVNTFVPPIFARLKNNIPELNRIAFFSSQMGTLISVIAATAATLFLYFWVENDQKELVTICYFILVSGNLFHSISGSSGYMCHMTGLEAKSSRVIMVSAILNLTIGIVLVPYIGIIGAAIGTAVALAVNKIMMSYVAYKSLGMKSSFLFKYFEPK